MGLSEVDKNIVDVASVGGLGLVFVDILPAMTAALTFVWILIRVYETQTVQNILKKITGGTEDLQKEDEAIKTALSWLRVSP